MCNKKFFRYPQKKCKFWLTTEIVFMGGKSAEFWCSRIAHTLHNIEAIQSLVTMETCITLQIVGPVDLEFHAFRSTFSRPEPGLACD